MRFRCAERIASSPRLDCANCGGPSAPGCARCSRRPSLDPAIKELSGFDVAFRLAPRINAAGRMDVASQVIELFCTRDPVRAQELATQLELLNRQRRDTEAAALASIEERLRDD